MFRLNCHPWENYNSNQSHFPPCGNRTNRWDYAQRKKNIFFRTIGTTYVFLDDSQIASVP